MSKRKTQDDYVKEVYDLVGDKYTVLGQYDKAKTKVLMRHETCGNEYSVTPSNFLRGHRCPCCAVKIEHDKLRKTSLEFSSEVKELVGEEYKVVSEYQGTNTKLRMKHTKCGLEYSVTPNHFLRDRRCPFCSYSHGEEYIANYLKSKGIPNIPQFSMKHIRDKAVLTYDFYLPWMGTGYLIEYQGEQHYKPQPYFGGEKQFQTQKYHDYLKKLGLTYTGIELIEIPYTVDTQEKVCNFLDTYFNLSTIHIEN